MTATQLSRQNQQLNDSHTTEQTEPAAKWQLHNWADRTSS